MSPDWIPLEEELERWRAAGLVLPIWWRDDDAIAPTPALDRLIALSGQHGLPVHLAVIPEGATDALAKHITAQETVIPVVHGWAHRNHAPANEKKSEFGAHRPLNNRRADATQALARLQDLFGPRLRPLFVPPWNRIAPDLVGDLARLGYAALSTFTPREAPMAAPGLAQVNTQFDPIEWKGNRSLVAPDRLVTQMAAQLADRRTGRADNTEPYGLLTHHLMHDNAIWEFTDALLTRLMNGPVRPWVMPAPTQDTPT